jgi:GT2 family glycosyltransferase
MCNDLKQYFIVKRSGLFDKAYYLLKNPDVRNADVNPLMHYIKAGWKEGRNPSRTFGTTNYIKMHPELEDSELPPLVHYLQITKEPRLGLLPSIVEKINHLYEFLLIKRNKLFDEKYYLKTYPDVRKIDINPLMHFIKFGWKQMRNPSSLFNTGHYLEVNPDAKEEALNPLIHYLKVGKKEGRKLTSASSDVIGYHYVDLSSHDERMKLIELSSQSPPRTPDILILPIIDWEFRFQRPQQLAVQFARMGHRVFYLKAGLYYRPNKAPLIKKLQNNIYSAQLAGGDHPIDFQSALTDQNIEDLTTSIEYLRDHLSINAAIVKVDLPFWSKFALHLKGKFGWPLLYDCMDYFSGFSTVRPVEIEEEQTLLKHSDLVLATSHFLFEHVGAENENAILVPNATDFELFHQAKQPIQIKEMKGFSSPIIGYYGAISDWFDTYLVGELASEHPEWTFVLIGHTHMADLRPLLNLSNVHLIGEKPHKELIGYLSHFDVCMIPFKQIPLTNATNPVKMYEYLSAGKPIVATRLEELSHYQEFVRLATTKQEWEQAIGACLSEHKTPALLEERFNFAEQNTWAVRGKKIESELVKLYPKVSIILLTFDNLSYTRLCLESIIENTSYQNYEMVIVDNASQKDTVQYLKMFAALYPNVKLILNDENLGFSKGNNQGFKHTQGEYIVFLNNDTIVTPGWIQRLLNHLIKNPSAGMVGPVTNSIGNEAKIDITYTELADINTFAAHRAKNYAEKAFNIRVLALYCAMISRALFEQVGGLDERYRVGMFEDDDLAMKIHQVGLNLLCAEDVFVHHFHRATLDRLGMETFQRIFDENKKKFEEKWETEWIPHQYRR